MSKAPTLLAILIAIGWLFAPEITNGAALLEKEYIWRPDPPAAWKYRSISLERGFAVWPDDVKSFADQAGLTDLSGSIRGGFIHPGPMRLAKNYTAMEAFDLINEALQGAKNTAIIVTSTTVTTVGLDEPWQRWPRLPRVRLQDLPQCGQTEIVEVLVKMNPKDVPPDRRWFGDVCKATPLANGRINIRCTVSSLVRMTKEAPMLDGW